MQRAQRVRRRNGGVWAFQWADYVIVGGGLAGLATGALLADQGHSVCLLEAHERVGGAAHGFSKGPYYFDTGPSLFAGGSLSGRDSSDPLAQLLRLLGIKLPVARYNTWGVLVPEGRFNSAVGAKDFSHTLRELRGRDAAAQFAELQRFMKPLAEAAVSIPPVALRRDLGIWRTVTPHLPRALRHAAHFRLMSAPFSRVLDQVGVRDAFLRGWMDLLCFLLSGLPSDGTPTAEMAFMFRSFYGEDAYLEYPLGGVAALAQALKDALEKRGGKVYTSSPVQSFWTENASQRVVGVTLVDGRRIKASRRVVSCISLWDTARLLQDGSFQANAEPLPSFLHAHLVFKALDPESASTHFTDYIRGGQPPEHDGYNCHYIVVDNWERLTEPQNVVAISIPSVLDPSLSRSGEHTLHAYTPATEPYELWENLDRERYRAQKLARGQVLLDAIARAVPGCADPDSIRMKLIGTPLTHEQYLRRYRGTYGAKPLLPWIRHDLPAGLALAGENSFPGIGVPAVITSALLTALGEMPATLHARYLQRLFE